MSNKFKIDNISSLFTLKLILNAARETNAELQIAPSAALGLLRRTETAEALNEHYRLILVSLLNYALEGHQDLLKIFREAEFPCSSFEYEELKANITRLESIPEDLWTGEMDIELTNAIETVALYEKLGC
jgi:hypothetical protein